jgi:hypothetical protein
MSDDSDEYAKIDADKTEESSSGSEDDEVFLHQSFGISN